MRTRIRWIAFISVVVAFIAIGIAFALNLFVSYPDVAADGSAWDRSWEMLGSVLGVEKPQNGLNLLENDSVLTGDDTYYAVWAVGEPENYVNADGDDTDLYEASLYLLLYGCTDRANAQTAMTEWIERENQSYHVLETTTETINGQEYTLLTYEVDTSNSNPYARGVTAFGIYENYVISAELTCLDTFDGDEQTMLRNFLDGCHYSSQK